MSKGFQITLAFICMALAFGLFGPVAFSGTPPSESARFEQNLGARLPRDVVLTDELGVRHALSDYEGSSPLILVFTYFRCPNLCTLVLNGLVQALQGLPDALGKDYRVLAISIDPSETPRLALAKKRTYLAKLGAQPSSNLTLTSWRNSWSFLTGPESEVRRLAKIAGFHYARDPGSGEYAHPSGLLVVAPDGRISKYFFGIQFDPKALHSALRTARAGKLGSWVEEILLYCFHYEPNLTPNGPRIMRLVRAAGVAGAFSLALFLALLFRADPLRKPEPRAMEDRA